MDSVQSADSVDEDTDAGDVKLGLESAKGLAGKLLQAVFGFVGSVIFARHLGPISFGGFYFLYAVVTFTDRPVRGFITAARKRYSEDGARHGEIFGGVLAAIFVLTPVVGVTAFAFRTQLARMTAMSDAWIVFVILFITIISFIAIQNLLGASGQPAVQIWLDTIRSVVTLPLQLIFVLGGLGASGMGYGLAGASIVTVGIAMYFIDEQPVMPSAATVQSLWAYAKYSILASIIGKAYGRMDILLLGGLLSVGALGKYVAVFKLTIPATFIASTICTGLMPKLSNLNSRGKEVGNEITNAVSYASLLAIPILFGAVALTETIIVTVYGHQYEGAGQLLVGIALYRVAATQAEVYRSALDGLDLPDIRLRIDIISLAVNLIGGVGLLFYLRDPIGVVVASVGAEGLRLLLSANVIGRRVDGVDWLPRPLLDQIVAGAIMFTCVEALAKVVIVRDWLALGILVGIGGITYGVVLFAVSAKHRHTAVSIWEDFQVSLLADG